MDYAVYHFKIREKSFYIALYLALDGVIAYLFFRSVIAFVLLLPGVIPFMKELRRTLAGRRKREMQEEFLTGMQLVSTSLQAGYAVENAFREALKELGKIYESDAFIIQEFQFVVAQVSLNRTVESLLMDLGQRSHVEDIRNFAEVFYTAKRTGGDLMAIIQNTVSSIQQKQETRLEIETSLSGKRMEQSLMSAIPLFILGYVDLSSPGFLDVLYHNITGIAVMAACLVIYIIAFLWGRKIMTIQV